MVLKDGSGLSEAGIRDGSTLIFKDLGPQIGYQTVFFWEYLGPLVIYALVYLLPASFVYPASASVSPALSSSWFSRALPSSASSGRSLTQTLACVYWCFHYAKRIYETFHVHRWVYILSDRRALERPDALTRAAVRFARSPGFRMRRCRCLTSSRTARITGCLRCTSRIS